MTGSEPDCVTMGRLSTERGLARRDFLAAGAALGASLVAGCGSTGGPRSPEIVRVRLASGEPSLRIAQISDLHHKGDVAYAEEIVSRINSLAPDLVCFTGDLIEDVEYLGEALELLSGIEAPMFGVPGNHEYWSHAPFDAYEKVFASSGGAWLENRVATIPEHDLAILGVAEQERSAVRSPQLGRSLLLTHYPAFIDALEDLRFDLMLAGHSHGGQIRIPGMERAFVPPGVGKYVRGRFDTPAGTLYVSPGLGTAVVPFRVNCPPEIALFEL
ncbi:MAG: metallophosphoesterase [bacterium]|nr:metallophosphoesterase [bacterium]